MYKVSIQSKKCMWHWFNVAHNVKNLSQMTGFLRSEIFSGQSFDNKSRTWAGDYYYLKITVNSFVWNNCFEIIGDDWNCSVWIRVVAVVLKTHITVVRRNWRFFAANAKCGLRVVAENGVIEIWATKSVRFLLFVFVSYRVLCETGNAAYDCVRCCRCVRQNSVVMLWLTWRYGCWTFATYM